MGYVLINDFIGGVDRTRERYAAAQGTIWAGINGHISRGGDFEKRKAFQAWRALPEGETIGLARDADGLRVFGIAASVAGMPTEVTYTQIAHPTNPSLALERVADWDLFNGLLYVIGKYDNGDHRHFYNGANVSDWGAGGNNPAGFGTIVRTHDRKVYSAYDSLLWFSELDSATNVDSTASGSGFVNISNHQGGAGSVTALGDFQDKLAIFARSVVQIWTMEADDANNAPGQTLHGIGTRSPRTVQGFGELDAFFLADTGVRSLRARSGTDIAGVDDVGTPIDPLIAEFIADLTDTQIEQAHAVVDPQSGRYLLTIADRIFVFSYFPSKKVSAWTWYEPGLTFTDMVAHNGRLYARAGDTIYLYGGDDGETYDRCQVTLSMPFLAGGKPATYKQIKAVDIAARGTWSVKLLVNPNDENEYVDCGEISGVTYNLANVGAVGHATHIAAVMVNEDDGAASVSQFVIHNDGAESE